jgi:hypothetical protein
LFLICVKETPQKGRYTVVTVSKSTDLNKEEINYDNENLSTGDGILPELHLEN